MLDRGQQFAAKLLHLLFIKGWSNSFLVIQRMIIRMTDIHISSLGFLIPPWKMSIWKLRTLSFHVSMTVQPKKLQYTNRRKKLR